MAVEWTGTRLPMRTLTPRRVIPACIRSMYTTSDPSRTPIDAGLVHFAHEIAQYRPRLGSQIRMRNRIEAEIETLEREAEVAAIGEFRDIAPASPAY